MKLKMSCRKRIKNVKEKIRAKTFTQRKIYQIEKSFCSLRDMLHKKRCKLRGKVLKCKTYPALLEGPIL